MEPKVSVIIPVYNREDMIADCIESVRRQSLEALEILCVDDGSTDGTAGVIRALMERDPRIRLERQENRGPGPARNRALESASGEYVAFLDSDDRYLDPDALRRMTEACDTHGVDICGAWSDWERDGEVSRVSLFEPLADGLPDSGRWVGFEEYPYEIGYCSFLYRRRFLNDAGAAFPCYREYEDPVFFVTAMTSARGFWLLPVRFLSIRVWEHAAERKYKEIYHILEGVERNLRLAYRHGYRKLYENIFCRLNVDFRLAIFDGISAPVMEKLLQIDSFHRSTGIPVEFSALSEIFEAVKNIRIYRKADAYSTPVEIKTVLDKLSPGALRAFFRERGIRDVVIYGAGAYGSAFYRVALESGLTVAGVMDQKVREFEGIKTSTIGEPIPDCDAVVVALFDYKDVADRLRGLTDKRVLAFWEILRGCAETGNGGSI